MSRTVHDVLSDAFTKVAQKACRNGEKDTREWPPLHALPAPESWRMVGDQYAREVLAEIGVVLLQTTLAPPPKP